MFRRFCCTLGYAVASVAGDFSGINLLLLNAFSLLLEMRTKPPVEHTDFLNISFRREASFQRRFLSVPFFSF